MTLQILDTNNKKVGDVELDKSMSEKVKKAVLYYAVKASRNNLRHGTASVKDRSDINKTTKKIYRQKGTGNARHGAKKANIFVGGASTHGPHPRSYVEKVNKKFKAQSYREVFKYLIQNDSLKILKEIKIDKPSTKEGAKVLKNLDLKKALVILPQENKNAHLSFRNLRDVKVINESNVNVYDMLRYENVVLTADCFGKLKERYSL